MLGSLKNNKRFKSTFDIIELFRFSFLIQLLSLISKNFLMLANFYRHYYSIIHQPLTVISGQSLNYYAVSKELCEARFESKKKKVFGLKRILIKSKIACRRCTNQI